MTTLLRPHDLIWLTSRDALEGITESWVEAAWHTGLPVVVRRDVDSEGGSRWRARFTSRPAGGRMGEARKRVTRGFTRRSERCGRTAALALCDSATRSGGASAFSAGVAVDVGHYRQYRLRAGNRIPVIHADSDLRSAYALTLPISPDALTTWQSG